MSNWYVPVYGSDTEFFEEEGWVPAGQHPDNPGITIMMKPKES